MAETHYDVAIVGAGFSGPILAAKIAQLGIHPQTRDRLKALDILAKHVLKIRPGMPIMLCTGFSELSAEEKATTLGIKKFIMKDFSSQ